MKPTSFSGPGKIVNGQAVIALTAGGVGEQTIGGQFTFVEDGKTVPLKFEGKCGCSKTELCYYICR
jgi:hypothetical protein